MESKKRNFNEFSQNKIYKPNKKMKTENNYRKRKK